ncbi:MAG: hypothetical protein WDN76_01515 [Alphaproteobacteria bacterium]
MRWTISEPAIQASGICANAVDVLKIDGSFVHSMNDSAEALSIVKPSCN